MSDRYFIYNLLFKITHTTLINFYGVLVFIRRYNPFFFFLYMKLRKTNRKVDIKKLQDFLIHADKHSQFWHNRFKEYNVNIYSKEVISELEKLPILTKAEVFKFKEKISCYRVLSHNVNTSGTTGSALRFKETIRMESAQWAIWWRYRNDVGIGLFKKCGWFGGRKIISPTNSRIGYWRTVLPLNQVMFSAYHLDDHTVHRYIKKIESSRIEWLHGYPSQLLYFAELIERHKLKPPRTVKIITTGAEKLYESKRLELKRIFKCDVYQHYGLAEGVSNISENAYHKLIPDQDFAYTEFTPTTDNSVFNIVGTNYYNKAFPLIRYKTGDQVLINDKSEIEEILGREEDYVCLPNGRKIGRLDHIFKTYEEIAESQIYQYIDFSVEIRIVPRSNYSLGTEESLKKTINSYFSNKLLFKIVKVDQIERTRSNKIKFVISEIK